MSKIDVQHINKATKIKRRNDTTNFQLFLLGLPGMVAVFIFHYLPMFGIIIAFKKFNPNKGLFGSQWNGFDNFEFFFTTPDAVRIIRNTVLYSIDYLFLEMVFSVLVAILFYNLISRMALKVYNTIMILPTFVSMVLIAYIVYAMLNPAMGILNRYLGMIGLPNDVDWYSTPAAWPWILTVMKIWNVVGMGAIIYYAALMGIDESLFEAARVDGANKYQQMWYIALPHLAAIIAIQLILGFGSIFNGDFGLHYQLTRDVGTLYPTTDIINTYTFRGLKDGNMSVSAAVGLVQSVLGVIMVLGVNLIVKKISPENSMF